MRRDLGLLVFLAAAVPSFAMRLVLQRVKSASVSVSGNVISSIGGGLVALVGLHETDSAVDLQYCAKKLCASKLWENEGRKRWRQSVKQLDLEVLLVSQFTLYGDVSNECGAIPTHASPCLHHKRPEACCD